MGLCFANYDVQATHSSKIAWDCEGDVVKLFRGLRKNSQLRAGTWKRDRDTEWAHLIKFCVWCVI